MNANQTAKHENSSLPHRPHSRSNTFFRYLFSKSHKIHGSQVEHSAITDAFFLCLLAIFTILSAIVSFQFEDIDATCKILLALSAFICVLSSASSMRWPHNTLPGFIAGCAILGTVVESAIHNSGEITYTAPLLFPITLTVLMINRGLKLAINLTILLSVFILVGTAALGMYGSPTTLSPEHFTLARFLFLAINLIHVCAITFTFRASQEIQTDLLASQKEELVDIVEERRKFLAMASHELRTPMNAIIGSLEVLENSKDPSMRKDMFELVRDASRGLSSKLDDLLDMSNVENNNFKLSPSPTNILELTQRTLTLWQTHAYDKGLYLNLNHDDECNCELLVDSARIQQILNNLISKSIQETQSGGITIDLRCSTPASGEQAFVRIVVSDSSAGVDAENREKIFQPDNSAFYLDNHGMRHFCLHIARLVAQRMDGDIVLLDRPSPGTHFLFTFKALFQNAISEKKVAYKKEKQKFKILCVDDHPANLRILNILLVEQGFSIDVAMDGEQAVKLCASHRQYDAILMDIMMPGMTGVQACMAIKKLKTSNSTIPIIAVTANVAPEQVVQYLDAGMEAVIAKPIETRNLLSELNRALRLHDQEASTYEEANGSQKVETL